MKVNLARVVRIFSDSGGFKALSESDLQKLSDGLTTVSGITISSGETLGVICWLGARYNLNEVKYYHSSGASQSLSIFGKQAASDSWSTLSSTPSSGYTSVNLDGSTDKYEYIRVVHSVTTGSAAAYELEIYSDDDAPLFGSSGQFDELSVDSGTNTLSPEVIKVFNPDGEIQDIYTLLDAEDSDSFFLAQSLNIDGPYYAPYEKGKFLPSSYLWGSGYFDNTTTVSDKVVLVSGTVGYYYTPIIDLNSVEGQRFFWRATTSGSNKIDDTQSVDNLFTVDVRLSNIAPLVGWSSGELSEDGAWSVISGTIPFVPYPNNFLLNQPYKRYFQAKAELRSSSSGNTPQLEKIGIEEGLKLTISGGSYHDLYLKSLTSQHISGRNTELISWYFNYRNI